MDNIEYYIYSKFLFKILDDKLFILDTKAGVWAGKEILPEFTRNLPDDLVFQMIRKMLTKIGPKRANRIIMDTGIRKSIDS